MSANEQEAFRPPQEDASLENLRPLRSSLTPRAQVSQGFTVNADAAGNSLSAGDLRVRVEASTTATENADVVIEVSVIKETADATEVTQRAAVASRRPRALLAGFSHEEELFRTKWGWAAFAEAQRLGHAVARSVP